MLFTLFRSPQTAFDRVSIHHSPQTSPGQWTIEDTLKCELFTWAMLSSPLFTVRSQRLTEPYISSEGITAMGFRDGGNALKKDFILHFQMSDRLKPSQKWTMVYEGFDRCPDRRAILDDDITVLTTFPFPAGTVRVLSSVLTGPHAFPLYMTIFSIIQRIQSLSWCGSLPDGCRETLIQFDVRRDLSASTDETLGGGRWCIQFREQMGVPNGKKCIFW